MTPESRTFSLRGFVEERLFARRAALRLERAVFSFCFDDVPLSAAREGAPILEAACARGSFYLTGRLAEQGGQFIGFEEAAALARRGHHVGVHGWDHLHARTVAPADLERDALRARDALAEALGEPPEDFAWPHGEVALRAKRLLSRSFATLRGTRAGLHAGSLDWNCLRAVSLYGPGSGRDIWQRWIERAAAQRAWLIFYTHGVSTRPDRVSTRSDDFAWVVDACRRYGEISSVGELRARVPG